MQTLAAKYNGYKNIFRSFKLVSGLGFTFIKVR